MNGFVARINMYCEKGAEYPISLSWSIMFMWNDIARTSLEMHSSMKNKIGQM